MPRHLLHIPIALILSTLAGVTAAQQDEVSIPSSLLVSASSGDAEAQYLLGQSLDQGQLFGAEIREAFNWYKQSADQGYALAETVVGQMYVEGRGVPQNFSEGEAYLLRAASKGLSAAQLVLGGIKLESEEFPQAYLLFSLAMTLAEDEETYNEATAGRDEAETNLQEAEITVLQSRATACIESEFEQCDFGPLRIEDLSFLDVVEPEREASESITTPDEPPQQALLTPLACMDVNHLRGTSQVKVEGQLYPAVLTFNSRVPVRISREIASDLELEINRPVFANITTSATSREYVEKLSLEVFSRDRSVEKVPFIENPLLDVPYIEISLRAYRNFLLELDFAREKICLHDKSKLNIEDIANLRTDVNPAVGEVREYPGGLSLIGSDVIAGLVESKNLPPFWLSLLPLTELGFVASIGFDSQLDQDVSFKKVRLSGADTMAYQFDQLQFGPFELNNVFLTEPDQLLEDERKFRDQLGLSTRIGNSWNGEKQNQILGFLGLDVLRNFSVVLDFEKPLGYVYTPDTSAMTTSTSEQSSEPQQVAEQSETTTDMSAMSLSDDLRPASFEGGDSDFISRIEFPDVEGDVDVEVLCEAGITRSGRFDWNSCFPTNFDAEEEFIDAVNRASRRAQINPAMRNGRTSSVMTYYRVAFRQDGGNQAITVFPNNGIDKSTYGERYFSPQWVIRRGTRFPCGNASGRQNSISAFDIRIAASGDATQTFSYSNEDITADREKERCERDAARFADREWFIPGALDGSFVEATFRNLTWNDSYRRALVVPRDRSNSGAAMNEYCINRPLAC